MDPFARRRLGRSTLELPTLGFGGAPLGDLFTEIGEANALATVEHACDLGLGYFDSAPWYGCGKSEHRLGHVFESSTGFRLPGGNVRSPDVAFVARGRFERDELPEGFSPVVPDLAIEVLSPEDRPRQVLDKIGEYLQAGVRLVWVVDPRKARAAIYRSLTDVREVGAGDALDGEEVVPGFRCVLGEILA